MKAGSTLSRKLALVLIVCAVVGTEFSYHFTLESRFDAIEQKLQQGSVAQQQMQDSIDALSASKTETLSGLNKQVEALQSSLAPMGKTTEAQNGALTQLRQEIAALQDAQTQQVDAQKKLSGYIAQLEEARREQVIAATTSVSVSPIASTQPDPAEAARPTHPPGNVPIASPTPPAVSLPASTDVPLGAKAPAPAAITPRALPVTVVPARSYRKLAMLPLGPNASDAMDLRPAESSTGESFHSVRAYPAGDAISR